jgi:hypothetical protein
MYIPFSSVFESASIRVSSVVSPLFLHGCHSSLSDAVACYADER